LRDTYLDRDRRLVSQGIWVRRRQERSATLRNSSSRLPPSELTAWQAKIRLSGDYTDSQFEEIEGKEAVSAIVARHIPDTQLEDLITIADLNTNRRAWCVQDMYTQHSVHVMLDEVTAAQDVNDTDSFRHEIGEVELTGELASGEDECIREEDKQRAVEGMRRTLREFMLRHSGYFQASRNRSGS